MVQKYVWWDDIEKRERCRVDVRMPKPLYDFLGEVAKKNGVSVNALVVGVLVYAADADAHRRLRVEVVPGVRVTEAKPGTAPVEIPAAEPSPGTRKRYRIPNVR